MPTSGCINLNLGKIKPIFCIELFWKTISPILDLFSIHFIKPATLIQVVMTITDCCDCWCLILREEAIKKAELLFQALDADGDGSLTQVSLFLKGRRTGWMPPKSRNPPNLDMFHVQWKQLKVWSPFIFLFVPRQLNRWQCLSVCILVGWAPFWIPLP